MSIVKELDLKNRLCHTIQQRKLQFSGHMVRADNLCVSILHGHVQAKDVEGGQREGGLMI